MREAAIKDEMVKYFLQLNDEQKASVLGMLKDMVETNKRASANGNGTASSEEIEELGRS